MSTGDWLTPDADGWQLPPNATRAVGEASPKVFTSGEEVQPPTYRVAAYTVYPSGFDRIAHPHKDRWCVTVADAGDGWAIRRGNMNLNIQHEWEFEPPPAMRDPAFLRRCRFNQHAALLRARRVIDKLTVQGLSFDEFVREVREESAELAKRHLEKERGVSMLRRIFDWHAAGKPDIRSSLDAPNHNALAPRPSESRHRVGRARQVPSTSH